MAVHVKGAGMAMVQALFDHNAEDILRKRSWGNLIILNEWHRRFGNTPPVALHQRLWQTRLVWPAIYGRTLSNDASIEILVNVKRFAEVLMNAEEERKNR